LFGVFAYSKIFSNCLQLFSSFLQLFFKLCKRSLYRGGVVILHFEAYCSISIVHASYENFMDKNLFKDSQGCIIFPITSLLFVIAILFFSTTSISVLSSSTFRSQFLPQTFGGQPTRCFPKNGPIVQLQGPRERFNNWLITLQRGIAFSLLSNASILYVTTGHFNFTWRLFDKFIQPDLNCWNIIVGENTNPDFSLKFMDLLKYPYYDKDSCPSLDMRLFQYFRPKEDLRHRVETWIWKIRQKFEKIVAVQFRTYNVKYELFKKSSYHLLEEYGRYNHHYAMQAFRHLGFELDNQTVVIGLGIEFESPYFQDLEANISCPFMKPPRWDYYSNRCTNGKSRMDKECSYGDQDGVLGDMWLASFADVILYNHHSTVARTVLGWSQFNSPHARLFPSADMFIENKIRVAGSCLEVRETSKLDIR